MEKNVFKSDCASCVALFKKLTDLNDAAETRQEELNSKLAVARLTVDALSREIISLRHQLNRPVSHSVDVQTENSYGVSMEVETQTEAFLYAHSEVFPALASFRATQNVRIGTCAFPGNKISDYVRPPTPVNTADLQYLQDEEEGIRLHLNIVGTNVESEKRIDVNKLPKHFIKLMAERNCTPDMFNVPNEPLTFPMKKLSKSCASASRTNSSFSFFSSSPRDINDLPPLARFHVLQQEEDRLALTVPTPPRVLSFEERVQEIIRRDIEDSDEDDWGNEAAALPPLPRVNSPRIFGVVDNDWVDDSEAIHLAYESLNRGRGRISSPARRGRSQHRSNPLYRRSQTTSQLARSSEDDIVRFADQPGTSAASSSNNVSMIVVSSDSSPNSTPRRDDSPISVSSDDTVVLPDSPLSPEPEQNQLVSSTQLDPNFVAAQRDQQLRIEARTREREHIQQRLEAMDSFERHPSAVLSPIQEIQFAPAIFQHGLAFLPIGSYVYIEELRRRLRIIIDMRPTGENFASLSLFQNSSAHILQLDHPVCQIANYMPRAYSSPIARHYAMINVDNNGFSFPVRIYLTDDWTSDRLVLSASSLGDRISNVSLSTQEFSLQYGQNVTAHHDFYWHTGLLEQANNPEALQAARQLGLANRNALAAARSRRNNRH